MPQSAENLEWLEQPPSVEEIDDVLGALRTDAATKLCTPLTCSAVTGISGHHT